MELHLEMMARYKAASPTTASPTTQHVTAHGNLGLVHLMLGHSLKFPTSPLV